MFLKYQLDSVADTISIVVTEKWLLPFLLLYGVVTFPSIMEIMVELI